MDRLETSRKNSSSSNNEDENPTPVHSQKQQQLKLGVRRLSMTNDGAFSSSGGSKHLIGANKENKQPLVTVLSEDHLVGPELLHHNQSTSAASSSYQQTKQAILSRFAKNEGKTSYNMKKHGQKESKKLELSTACDMTGKQKLSNNKKSQFFERLDSSQEQTPKGNEDEDDNDQVLPNWPSRIDAASLEQSVIQHQVYSLKDYSQVSGPMPTQSSSSTSTRLLKSMSQDRRVEPSAKRMSECIISSYSNETEASVAANSTKGSRLELIAGGKHRNPSMTSQHQLPGSATAAVANFMTGSMIGSSAQATSVQSLLPPAGAPSKSSGGSSSALLSESRIDRVRKLFVSPLSLRTSGSGTGRGNSKQPAHLSPASSGAKNNNNPRFSLQTSSSSQAGQKPHAVKAHHHIMHAMYRSSRGYHGHRSPMRWHQTKQSLGSSSASASGAMKSFRVYGCPLHMANNIYPITCFGRPDIYKQQSVPYILARLCNYIEEKSCHLTHEGIFRVSGNARLMEKLRTLFDRLGDAPLESESVDVATSASMLKMYLRELPEPLIPTRMNYHFITLAKKYSSLLARDNVSSQFGGLSAATNQLSAKQQKQQPERSSISQTFNSENNPSGGSSGGSIILSSSSDRQRMAFLRDLTKLIRKLPIENYNLLKYLACFLYRISLKQMYNKMCAEALGIVFGPNVFRIRSESYKGLKEQELTNQIMASIISYYKIIFDCELTDPLGNLVRSNESLNRMQIEQEENADAARLLTANTGSGNKKFPNDSTSNRDTSKGSASVVSASTTSTAISSERQQAKQLLPRSKCPKHGHHHHHHQQHHDGLMLADDYDNEDDDDDDDDDEDEEEDESDGEGEGDEAGSETDDELEPDEDDDLAENCDDESYSPTSGSDSYCSSLDSNSVESIYEGDIEGEHYDEEEDDEDVLEYVSDDYLEDEDEEEEIDEEDLDEEDLNTSECGSETSYTPSSSHDESDSEIGTGGQNNTSSFNSSPSTSTRVIADSTNNQDGSASKETAPALSSISCRVCKRRESAQLEANKLRIAASLGTEAKKSTSALVDSATEKVEIPGSEVNLKQNEIIANEIMANDEEKTVSTTIAMIERQKSSSSQNNKSRESTSKQQQVTPTRASSKRSKYERSLLLDNNRDLQQERGDNPLVVMMTSSDNALDQQRKTSRLAAAMLYQHLEPSEGNKERQEHLRRHSKRDHHQARQHSGRQHLFSRRRSSSTSSLLHLQASMLTSGFAVAPMARHERRKRSFGKDEHQQLEDKSMPLINFRPTRGHLSVRRKFHHESIGQTAAPATTSSRAYQRKSRHSRAHPLRNSEHSRLPVGINQHRASRTATTGKARDWKKVGYYIPKMLLDFGEADLDDELSRCWTRARAKDLTANVGIPGGDDDDLINYRQLRSYNSDETLLRSQEFVDDATTASPSCSAFKQSAPRRRFSGQDYLSSSTAITGAGTEVTITDHLSQPSAILFALEDDQDEGELEASGYDAAEDDREVAYTLKHICNRTQHTIGSKISTSEVDNANAGGQSAVAESAISMVSLLDRDQMSNYCHSDLSLSIDDEDPLLVQLKLFKGLIKSLRDLLRHGHSNGFSAETASILMKLTSDPSSSEYLDDFSACIVDHLSAKSVLSQLEETRIKLATNQNGSPQIDRIIQDQLSLRLQQKIALLRRKYSNLSYIREHYNRHHKHKRILAKPEYENKQEKLLIQLEDDLDNPTDRQPTKPANLSDREASSSFESTATAINTPTLLESTSIGELFLQQRKALKASQSQAITNQSSSNTCKFGTLCPVEFVLNIEKQLASKRLIGSRVIRLNEMNLLQLQSEKLELQKNLLRFEHWFGRPVSKLEYQLVSHLYERYRAVKIIKQRRQQQQQRHQHNN